MLVGKYAGRSVEYAKPLVRADLIESGEAAIYFEPESPVMSRTGNDCVISCEDQWYLTYGEPRWKEIVEKHVESDAFTLYNSETRRDFKNALGWLKEWGCARQFGLGTQMPFEESLVVESLSDSTIYMSYYTIAHMLQGEGNLFSDNVGPCGAPPSAFTNEVWDAIFLKAKYVEGVNGAAVPADVVAQLRAEFEYWYPMDLRVSGKDLIKNHLTMSLCVGPVARSSFCASSRAHSVLPARLSSCFPCSPLLLPPLPPTLARSYNHAAIWADEPEMWPRAMFTNGFVKVRPFLTRDRLMTYIMFAHVCTCSPLSLSLSLYLVHATRFVTARWTTRRCPSRSATSSLSSRR